MTTIYFAGPDVFRPDYAAHVARLRRLCDRAGLSPLIPGDAEAQTSPDPGGREEGPVTSGLLKCSCAICDHNLRLIERADGVVANLEPFRSLTEPDSGTVFECGFAFALGKFVVGIVPDLRDLAAKIRASAGPGAADSCCPDGWLIEDFGLPLNLMLAHTLAATVSSLDEAVAAAAGFRKM